MNINVLPYDWTHGVRGLLVPYGLIAVFSLVGLKHGRAQRRPLLSHFNQPGVSN